MPRTSYALKTFGWSTARILTRSLPTTIRDMERKLATVLSVDVVASTEPLPAADRERIRGGAVARPRRARARRRPRAAGLARAGHRAARHLRRRPRRPRPRPLGSARRSRNRAGAAREHVRAHLPCPPLVARHDLRRPGRG